ncbi:hypothetical protein QFC19_002701 [Naganishia cerealis]|uniref:Uncharacterized protein n=1 Tax=Naganishia cerealis TaxID=610337 RepID=A0ACC2W8P9_9TREE|nr:hypothetical protein QFC19_002701 [Naganishia cerealis]
MAQEEKVQLKDMLQRAFLANKREIYAGVPAYLLSVHFVNSWLEWVNDPVEVPRPIFSNRELFCEHDNLLVDPNWMPDHGAGLFVVVYDTLWHKISQLAEDEGEQSKPRKGHSSLTACGQINEHWDVFPMFQHIYCGEHELKDNTQILGDAGVLTDDTLHVICDEMPGGDVSIDDIDQEDVAGDITESLAGFGGTALFGLPTIEAADDTANATVDARAMSEDLTRDMAEEGPPRCKLLAALQGAAGDLLIRVYNI